MIRFLIGLLLGAATTAITWAVGVDIGWALVVGTAVAVIVWCAETIAEVTDLVGDFLSDLFVP
ncbi:hypothetical protein [Streptomyces sp. CBMA152]|uniref:hypothetical protein n=1 Tax=Streptomyces sp. CBMA152 TaxID=1896312 RepID=UPI00166101C6|nr:hypothetical protein [Streptomyces sp. CBMA152]MBD0743501.1 hypothetical protein [Streptomyces sp. CBMA152]